MKEQVNAAKVMKERCMRNACCAAVSDVFSGAEADFCTL